MAFELSTAGIKSTLGSIINTASKIESATEDNTISAGVNNFYRTIGTGNTPKTCVTPVRYFIPQLSTQYISNPWDENDKFTKLWPLLVQDVTLPGFNLGDAAAEATNIYGSYNSTGTSRLIPDSYELSISFLETQESIINNFILPWLCGNGVQNIDILNKSIMHFYLLTNENSQKATVATYSFYNCMPTSVPGYSLDQSGGGEITRTVNFSFEYCRVTTPYEFSGDFIASIFGKDSAITHLFNDINGLRTNKFIGKYLDNNLSKVESLIGTKL